MAQMNIPDSVIRDEIGDIIAGKSAEYMRGYAAGIRDQLTLNRKELEKTEFALSILAGFIARNYADDDAESR